MPCRARGDVGDTILVCHAQRERSAAPRPQRILTPFWQLLTRSTLNENAVKNEWRKIFHGQEVTRSELTKAKSLLDGLTGESPLHIRLARELAELKTLWKLRTKK